MRHFLGIFILFSIFLKACNIGPYNRKNFQTLINDHPKITSQNIITNAKKSFYVFAQNKDLNAPLVVFIHGSPGGWEANAQYLQDPDLLKVANMISIDRYGYGQSDHVEYSQKLTTQSDAIKTIIEQYETAEKVILVGHSYSGPVIAKTGIDYPDLIDHLIFLAPAVDPKLERTKWFQYPAQWPFIEPIVPKNLRESNNEIMALKDELESFENQWDHIHAHITVIQGKDDDLVPHENTAFIKEKRPKAEILYLENQGHFLPWEQYDLVKAKILEAISVE
ncbi:MAG: alpha/beta hydrolase [Pseudomonadota bacterium]